MNGTFFPKKESTSIGLSVFLIGPGQETFRHEHAVDAFAEGNEAAFQGSLAGFADEDFDWHPGGRLGGERRVFDPRWGESKVPKIKVELGNHDGY